MEETDGTLDETTDEPDNEDESDSDVDGGSSGSSLPAGLQPEFGFRCGITEVDARSNCKPKCTNAIDCSEGEGCWGVSISRFLA
jgi:hypothetical protein